MITKVRIKLNQVLRTTGETPNQESQILGQIADELKSCNFSGTQFNIDWTEVLEYAAENDFWTDRLFRPRSEEEYKNAMSEFSRLIETNSIKKPPKLMVNIKGEDEFDNVQSMVALLSKIFLAANLTSPGMINFWSAELFVEGRDFSGHPYIPKEIRLFAGFCEGAYSLSKKLGWPTLETLDFREVWHWLDKVNVSAEQAVNSMQNALFCLLYSSDQPMIPNMTSLLWIVLGLESLFDLPETKIASTLRNRMFGLLGQPTKNRSQISGFFTDLYRIRSRFVHGQLPNLNPMRMPKGNIDDFMRNLMESSDFGGLCMIASLQKIIKKGWTSITFEEKVEGHQ